MRGKYRGKRIDNGEWVYGSLISDRYIVGDVVEWNEEYFNTEWWAAVDPETVGQAFAYYGKEFFIGDMVAIPCYCDSEYGCSHGDGIYEIVWYADRAGYALKHMDTGKLESLGDYDVEDMQVIGNRWDTPEGRTET